jgi:hypothetical protein
VRVLRFGHGASISNIPAHSVLKSTLRHSNLGRTLLIASQRCSVPGSARSEPEVSISRDVQAGGRLERRVAISGLGIKKLFSPLRTRRVKEWRLVREGRVVLKAKRSCQSCCVLSLAAWGSSVSVWRSTKDSGLRVIESERTFAASCSTRVVKAWKSVVLLTRTAWLAMVEGNQGILVKKEVTFAERPTNEMR